MGYRELAVPEHLRGIAECAWTASTTGAPQQQRVLPDGCMDLVWTGSELVLAGPDTSAHFVTRKPGSLSAGVRFAPGQLPTLIDVPAAAVRDERVPLLDLLPGAARAAQARLEAGADPVPVLLTTAAALPGESPPPALRAIAARLAAGAAVADVADGLGWTDRTLHRRCLAAFGYGPAVLRRVLRFRRATALLHRGVPLAAVAAEAGYADQPHLTREVTALAGAPPGALAGATAEGMPRWDPT